MKKRIELDMFGPNPTLEEFYKEVKDRDIVELIGSRPGDERIIAMTIERYHELMVKLAEGIIDNEI